MNKIVTQQGMFIADENLVDCKIEKFESLTGTELRYDSCEFTVAAEIYEVLLVTENNEALQTTDDELLVVDASESWKYGAFFKVYHDDELLGKFYVENVKKVGKSDYKITAISAVGLLSNSQHYGGIYQGTMFEDLVAEIIGGQIPYSIDPTVARQPIYGWLPIATRRENLHQALFAMSASIKKDTEGDVYITALSKDTARNIPDSRIYAGGSVDYPQAKKAIALSEHAYIGRNDDEEITLYDAEIAADYIKTPLGTVVRGGLVLFDSPCHDLQITGATILESGVNYAVLSPTAECTLTGKKYTHTVRQVTRPETPVDGSEEDENKVVVEEATLVSIANSEAVANRLADYYGSAKTVTMDIIQGEESTGDAVTFNDPFDEETEGLITSIDMKLSGIVKSTAEIVADYDPPDIGNYYNNVVILAGISYFDIPPNTEKVRVILIGGGQAGHKGDNGEDGQESYHNLNYIPQGGNAGAAGNGGKILIFTLETPNAGRINVSSGAGGTGGDAQEGGATTATYDGITYTSADGTVSSIGFIEIFGGDSYGMQGEANNTKGGNGGNWNESSSGENYTDASGTWYGGAKGAYKDRTSSAGQYFEYSGGCGGGAARGSNGQNGHDGRDGTSDGNKGGDGGNGGAGADANPLIYGMGGQGGYGGGGGGMSGREWIDGSETFIGYDAGGAGGIGGAGGNGAAGCVIIYY